MMSLSKTRIRTLSIWSCLSVMLVVLFTSTSTVNAADNEWLIYRGPDQNGITTETNWSLNGASIAWKAKVGSGYSSFTVCDDKVYTMGNNGRDEKDKNKQKDTIYCLDVNSGKEIWTYSYPCLLEPKYYDGGTSATPTIDGNNVYTLSKFGDVFCLNKNTGKVVWGKNLAKELGAELPTWGFAGSPLIWKDLVIYNVGSEGVALDKKSGRIVWQNGKEMAGYSTPVPTKLDGKDCLAIFNAKGLVGVNPDTGAHLWDFTWDTKHGVNAADPIFDGNLVFVSAGYNKGCGLFKIEGNKTTELWTSREMRNHMNSCVLWKGNLYGFDESELKCIDMKTGKNKWGKKGLGKGSLMMSNDGRLLILSEKGQLVEAPADPAEYKETASLDVVKGRCWTVPVLSNGKVFARSSDGDMACVNVAK